MDVLLAILASVTTVSLISFVGAMFVGLKESVLRRLLMAFVGFASGTLLGGAFFGLLPESLPQNGATTTSYGVIAGIVAFFSIEKFLHWRHCHEENCEVHAFAYTSLVGDGVHNFIDGMLIAATYMLSFELGVLIYGGFSKKKALTYNFAIALTAVLGAVVTYFLALQGIYALLIPFAAGGFIYIAATDLMPELHKKSHAGESIVQFASILLGLGLMAYLTTAIGA
jgi:zinc and cadmium transporter